MAVNDKFLRPVPLEVLYELHEFWAKPQRSHPLLLTNYIHQVCLELAENQPAAILQFKYPQAPELTVAQQRQLHLMIGEIIGLPLAQNAQGDRVICVYDRDPAKTISQGARYHQTHEGGELHTDNVNVSENWEVMVLGCLASAPVGGESIFITGQALHRHLRDNHPKILAVLQKPFLWERRGLGDTFYQAPVITYDEQGRAKFRYLRGYMESAYQRSGQKMSEEQLAALDVLDALLADRQFQVRHNMQSGEILLAYDSYVFHGRTSFTDDADTVAIENYRDGENLKLKRTMDRLWIKQTARP